MSDELSFNEAEQVNRQSGDDEQQRLRRYKAAWSAYYGHHKQPLKVKKGKPDDNVIINYIRLAVNVKNSFLWGEPKKELTFSTDMDEGAESPQEDWLRKAWKANRKLTTLYKLGLNGAICGNSYVKVMQRQPYPRIVVLDPAIVRPVWNPDDIDEVVKWIIEYKANDPNTGRPVMRRQVIERSGNTWAIMDEQRRLPLGRWQTLRETPWPFAWSPIHQCQNMVDPNVFWGIADVEEDVINLNDAINFIVSNINRILRYHAHPKTWGKGFREDQLKIGVDETLVMESADAELHNLEMVSDLSSSIAFYQAVRKALREVTTVPEVALGGMEDASRVSSLALKVLYGPLLMQTGTKRITYGEMLQELNSHLLELGDQGTEIEVSNKWPFVLPEDPQQEAQVALMDQQLGASKETLLRKRGYDPQKEAEQRAEEGETLGAQLLRAFDQGDENA